MFWRLASDDLGPTVRLSPGTQILSALDQLTPAQRDMAAVVWYAHASLAPRARQLNNPRHVLLRFELLTRLHDEDLNALSVIGTENPGAQRFPVSFATGTGTTGLSPDCFARERTRPGPLSA